jgi:hypothetical protein
MLALLLLAGAALVVCALSRRPRYRETPEERAKREAQIAREARLLGYRQDTKTQAGRTRYVKELYRAMEEERLEQERDSFQ